MKKRRTKFKLAVWKFASCDGCQLSLLDCEDELLELAGTVRICHFSEMTKAEVKGPYDLSLVEGSITTLHDAEWIQQIRRESRRLVTMGACATAGGIQALRNFLDTGAMVGQVYPNPWHIQTLDSSTPIANHVFVDHQVQGCPPNKMQLLEVISALLANRRPVLPSHSLCLDCKRRGIVCVMVAQGKPCLGPVTATGCGVLCPSYGRGCYGCFGPMESPNTASLCGWMHGHGVAREELARLFRTFNANAPEFRQASIEQEKLHPGAGTDASHE
jgi:coenzyme F420-reducing hydrogenase gamma subunit